MKCVGHGKCVKEQILVHNTDHKQFLPEGWKEALSNSELSLHLGIRISDKLDNKHLHSDKHIFRGQVICKMQQNRNMIYIHKDHISR